MQPMLTIAVRAARKAGEILIDAIDRANPLTIEEKGRNDYVTEIDKACEKEIIYHLRKAYPDHAILGEESGSSEGNDSDYEWVIDPLDGTTNFIHGIPHYCISIACKYKGRVQHAVIFDPIKREEFTASRGDGAQLNGKRIRVTDTKSLDGALIATGIPFNGFAFANVDAFLSCLKEVAGQTAGIRRAGSAALDLAYVAAGRFDGFWEMNLKEWDIAAGTLLITEAGGRISDFKGGNDFLSSGHIVCGSPKVFKPLLRVVEKHMGYIQK